jgi:Mn-dependent DtxR family transcriptional regulator
MSTTAQEIRQTVKDALLSRAYFTEELAAELRIHPSTCNAIIRELQDGGEPVQRGEGGRWLIVYPKGRRCIVCGAFLSSHNPGSECLCHGRECDE